MNELMIWIPIALSVITVSLLIAVLRKMSADDGPDVAGLLREEFKANRDESNQHAREARKELARNVKNSGDSLVKIDAESGEVAWRLLGSEQKDSGAFSSPSFGVLGGKEQLVVQSRVDLYGVDPASGEAIWTRPVRAFRGMNILTPTIFDGGVFTSAYGGRAQLVDVAAGEELLVTYGHTYHRLHFNHEGMT